MVIPSKWKTNASLLGCNRACFIFSTLQLYWKCILLIIPFCAVSSKHETFTQCWNNVGPALQTVGQHCTNIGWTSRTCCVYISMWLRFYPHQATHSFSTSRVTLPRYLMCLQRCNILKWYTMETKGVFSIWNHDKCLSFHLNTHVMGLRPLYIYVYSYSAGIDFRCLNLTSTDVRFWHLKSIPAL